MAVLQGAWCGPGSNEDTICRNQLRLMMYRMPDGLDRGPAKYFHGRKRIPKEVL